jgi:hypothetical protein
MDVEAWKVPENGCAVVYVASTIDVTDARSGSPAKAPSRCRPSSERLAQTLGMVATCLAHGLNPRAYLHFVLHKLVMERWPNKRLHELLPDVVTKLEVQCAHHRRFRHGGPRRA